MIIHDIYNRLIHIYISMNILSDYPYINDSNWDQTTLEVRLVLLGGAGGSRGHWAGRRAPLRRQGGTSRPRDDFSQKKYEKNGDFQEILRGFSRGFLRDFLESTIYKYLQHLDVFFDVLFREFFWCFLGMFRLRLFFWWLFLMIFDEGEFRWCWMMLDDVLEN